MHSLAAKQTFNNREKRPVAPARMNDRDRLQILKLKTMPTVRRRKATTQIFPFIRVLANAFRDLENAAKRWAEPVKAGPKSHNKSTEKRKQTRGASYRRRQERRKADSFISVLTDSRTSMINGKEFSSFADKFDLEFGCAEAGVDYFEKPRGAALSTLIKKVEQAKPVVTQPLSKRVEVFKRSYAAAAKASVQVVKDKDLGNRLIKSAEKLRDPAVLKKKEDQMGEAEFDRYLGSLAKEELELRDRAEVLGAKVPRLFVKADVDISDLVRARTKRRADARKAFYRRPEAAGPRFIAVKK